MQVSLLRLFILSGEREEVERVSKKAGGEAGSRE